MKIYIIKISKQGQCRTIEALARNGADAIALIALSVDLSFSTVVARPA